MTPGIVATAIDTRASRRHSFRLAKLIVSGAPEYISQIIAGKRARNRPPSGSVDGLPWQRYCVPNPDYVEIRFSSNWL